MKISAAIPCCNGSGTLAEAIESIRQQSVPLLELLVIDDGSTDGSGAIAERAGARVLRHESNLGRGAARSRAVLEAKGELILFCDAGMALEKFFLERALSFVEEGGVAGAFGCVEGPKRTVVERWRERHLFGRLASQPRHERALLATTGTLLRRDAVLGAGNFDRSLAAYEDAELGRRLLAAGWKVIYSPELRIRALANDNAHSVLRRYARWNNASGKPGWRHYGKLIAFSARTMAAQDLRAGDVSGALLSLACPHYQFWTAKRGGSAAAGKESRGL